MDVSIAYLARRQHNNRDCEVVGAVDDDEGIVVVTVGEIEILMLLLCLMLKCIFAESDGFFDGVEMYHEL